MRSMECYHKWIDQIREWAKSGHYSPHLPSTMAYLLSDLAEDRICLEQIGTSEDELRELFREWEKIRAIERPDIFKKRAMSMLGKVREISSSSWSYFQIRDCRKAASALTDYLSMHNITLADLGSSEAEIRKLVCPDIIGWLRWMWWRLWLVLDPRARLAVEKSKNYNQRVQQTINGTVRLHTTGHNFYRRLGKMISNQHEERSQYLQSLSEKEFFESYLCK